MNLKSLNLPLADKEYAAALRQLAILYIKNTEMMYVDYMKGAQLFAGFFIDTERPFLDYWPNIPGPDVCSKCHTIYGITMEGRLRSVCHQCRTSKATGIDGYMTQQLAKIWKIHEPAVRYLLACAIIEIRERQDAINATSNPQKTEPQQHPIIAYMPQEIPALETLG